VIAFFSLLKYQVNNLTLKSLFACYNNFRVNAPKNGLQLIFWITLPFAGAFQRKKLSPSLRVKHIKITVNDHWLPHNLLIDYKPGALAAAYAASKPARLFFDI
jgi:hypothetical protein